MESVLAQRLAGLQKQWTNSRLEATGSASCALSRMFLLDFHVAVSLLSLRSQLSCHPAETFPESPIKIFLLFKSSHLIVCVALSNGLLLFMALLQLQ